MSLDVPKNSGPTEKNPARSDRQVSAAAKNKKFYAYKIFGASFSKTDAGGDTEQLYFFCTLVEKFPYHLSHTISHFLVS